VRRQEHSAAFVTDLTQDLEEGVLDKRVEAGSRLVEDEERRPVKQGLDQADLLPVAAAETPHRQVEVEIEPAGIWGASPDRPSPQPAEVLEQLPAVMRGSRPNSPGRYPVERRTATLSRCASMPRTVTRPAVGRSRSSSSRMVVVFPAPFVR